MCDKRLVRLISYSHSTSYFKQYLFLTLILTEILKNQNRPQEDFCKTFVPSSWMCKKTTSVSHSSTEAEIISLDASLRMNGIPALDLWDWVTEVFHSPNQLEKSKGRVEGNLLRDTPSNKHMHHQTKTPIQHDNLESSNVDYVSSNAKSSQFGEMPSSDHNDHQGQKSNNETRIQDPQSCF